MSTAGTDSPSGGASSYDRMARRRDNGYSANLHVHHASFVSSFPFIVRTRPPECLHRSTSSTPAGGSEPLLKSHPEVVAVPVVAVAVLLVALGFLIWHLRKRSHSDFNEQAAARFEAYVYPPEMSPGNAPPSYSDTMDHRMERIPIQSGVSPDSIGSSGDRHLIHWPSSSTKPLPSPPTQEGTGFRYPPPTASTPYDELSQGHASAAESYHQLLPFAIEPTSPETPQGISYYSDSLPESYYIARRSNPEAGIPAERSVPDINREPLLD